MYSAQLISSEMLLEERAFTMLSVSGRIFIHILDTELHRLVLLFFFCFCIFQICLNLYQFVLLRIILILKLLQTVLQIVQLLSVQFRKILLTTLSFLELSSSILLCMLSS